MRVCLDVDSSVTITLMISASKKIVVTCTEDQSIGQASFFFHYTWPFLLAFVAFGMTKVFGLTIGWLSADVGHIVTLPLIAFAVLRIGRLCQPRLLLAISSVLLGLFFCVSLWFGRPLSAKNYEVALALLAGDNREANSSILLESFNRRLKVDPVFKIRHFSTLVTSERQAQQILKEQDAKGPLIWGDAQGLRVSLPDRAQSFLKNDFHSELYARYQMRVVDRIPAFAVSYRPREETALFLYKLLGQLNQSQPQNELELLQALNVVVLWSSWNHRAMAAFLLGNFYLERALANPVLDFGSLSCADAVYLAGMKYLRAINNPELYAALLNNRAVVHRVYWTEKRIHKSKWVMKKLLSSSRAVGGIANPYEISLISPSLAAENLNYLRNYSVDTKQIERMIILKNRGSKKHWRSPRKHR